MKKPAFVPKKGQIDYTHVRFAPVINSVVRNGNKLLVVQRSNTINFYPGYWNGISGFLDDKRSLQEKVAAEIREELGIPKNKIRKIQLGEIFHQEEPKYKKTWIVHPIIVDIKSATITLDWESQKYQWLTLREIRKLKLLPGFSTVLEKLSPWIKK